MFLLIKEHFVHLHAKYKIISMKHIAIISLCLFFCALISAQKQTFTVKGNIVGLEKGDSVLIFKENILHPEKRTCDTLLINKKNNFTYKKTNEGATFYTLVYHPTNKSKSTRNRSLTLFLGKGTVKLKGDTDHFSMVEKKGNDYKHKLVARYIFLTDSIASIESNAYDRYEKAMESNDGNAMKEALIELSKGHGTAELDSLTLELVNTVNDSEYAAALYLWNSALLSSAEIEKRLNGFTPEIQKSFTAKELRKIIEMKKSVEPGAIAPDFTLTDVNGEKVTLQDYEGKYLLIFHWGISKGCFRTNTELEQIYNMYHSKGLEILDFVQSDVQPGNYLSYTPELYRQLHPLLHHLWKSVYTSMSENTHIIKKYNLSAMPLLILISPEKKIIARNFGSTNEIVKILAKELIQ